MFAELIEGIQQLAEKGWQQILELLVKPEKDRLVERIQEP